MNLEKACLARKAKLKKKRNKMGGEKMVLNAEQGGPNAEGFVLESEES